MTGNRSVEAGRERPGKSLKGRSAPLWAAALMLALGAVLTTLWWLLDTPGSPVLYIVLPVTLAVYFVMGYLGWSDDRRGSPVRYWATIGVIVAGGAILLSYGVSLLVRG